MPACASLVSLLASVLCLQGCTDTRTTLVVVSVQGAVEGYESMRVGAILDGRPGTEVKDVRGDQRRFGIRLPEVVRESELLVQIEAQKEDCVAGRGSGRVRIRPAETRELVVPISALKTRLCQCSNVGWCWETPLPQGNTLNAVWAFSERDVWAVGGLGTIFHYDGTAWRSSPSGSVANLFALWGGDHDDLWAVGEQGVVLRYDGRSWTQVENPLRETQVQFRAVFGFAEGDVWIGGDAGALLRAPGHGALVVESSGARTAIRGIWGASAEDIWIVGDGGLLRRRNGTGWATLPGWTESRDLNAIWGTSQQDLWVGGEGGLMIHILDGMRTVETLASGVAIRDIFGPGAGAGDPDLWAVGGGTGAGSGVVLRRRNGPWTEMRVEGAERPNVLFGVHGSGSSSVWAVGQHGTILRWQGDQAQVVGTRSTNRDLLSVWASGPDDVWAVGGSIAQPESGAALLHFDGQVWSADPLERSLTLLRAVYGNGPKDVWAVGNRATVLHYNGQGWSAERVSGLTRANLRGLWVGEGGTVWVVGEGGVVLRRQAGPGGRWEALPTESRYSLHAVWGVGTGTEEEGLWVGGADPVQRGVLLARRGGAWVPVQGQGVAFTGVEAITGSGPKDIWALTRRSPLLHYDGERWQLVETNVVRWLEGLWAFSPEEAWAVGQDGFILFWNGKTWVRTISGASNDLHGIWGSGRYNQWAVGNGGTILRQRM